MERENREPIINPIDLPGGPRRMNETFTTDLRVNLGAYIPAVLDLNKIEANIEGLEWQFWSLCVRIPPTDPAGNTKVDINSLNIQQADLEVQNGTSTIWFSTTTNRVLKAKHEINGSLTVDVSQLGGGGTGLAGRPGWGNAAPGGLPGYPGGGMNGPGGFPGGGMNGPGGFPAPRARFGAPPFGGGGDEGAGVAE